jgi:uroporphyrinogen decarboxylase
MSTLIRKSLKKKNPIWLMRQAGRYLPEYQNIRKKQKNFINFCLNINASTKVTLQPIKRYDFDAAIIFSDILVIPYGLGQKVEFKKNEGPILGELQLQEFQKIKKGNFVKKLKNIYLAIKKTRKLLNKEKSLIGFAGSPWTILVYMVNKKSPKKEIIYKKILKNKKETKELLKIIEKFIYIHIEQQIKAGADTIQLFDSWAGLLNKKDLNCFCYQPTKRIIKKIKKNYPKVPIICFPKGIGENIVDFCKITKPNVLSIDSKINLDFVLKKINEKIIIQGGLDPKFLMVKEKLMEQKIFFYLNKFKNRSYIFNLGHGVLKETSPNAVLKLSKMVRSFK